MRPVTAAGMAVGIWAARAVVRRRQARACARQPGACPHASLEHGAWTARGLTLIRARMAPGEEPLSLTVAVTGADGKRRSYVPGATAPGSV